MYTVISRDMIFRYPDRVPLTHFVHRAKKFLACGPEFSVDFSAPQKSIGAQGGRKPSTFRLGSRYSTIAPLPPCDYNAMACIVFLLVIFRPFQ
jgi:hypothetical protein